MILIKTAKDFPAIVDDYLGTALWSSHNPDDCGDDDDDETFDNYSVYDFHPDSRAKAYKDCESFFKAIDKAGLFDAMLQATPKQSNIGHDLWLTAVGHGAGFWDGDYDTDERPNLGDELTRIVHDVYGHYEGNLYVEKGQVFIE